MDIYIFATQLLIIIGIMRLENDSPWTETSTQHDEDLSITFSFLIIILGT